MKNNALLYLGFVFIIYAVYCIGFIEGMNYPKIVTVNKTGNVIKVDFSGKKS